MDSLLIPATWGDDTVFIRDADRLSLALLKMAIKLIYAMKVKDLWTLNHLATSLWPIFDLVT